MLFLASWLEVVDLRNVLYRKCLLDVSGGWGLIPPTAKWVSIALDDPIFNGLVEDASKTPDIDADGGFGIVLPKHPLFEFIKVIDGDL